MQGKKTYRLIFFRLAQDLTNELHNVRTPQMPSPESLLTADGHAVPENGPDQMFHLSTDSEIFSNFSLASVVVSSSVMVELLEQYGAS